ncbi:MAG TPA: cysteine desulfurase [Anaerolineae bacterium]|nr:cysteine desulfurase [Anaerolineae bacterium]
MATASVPQQVKPFDVRAVRADFPILNQTVHGKTVAFLDSAASSQKPSAVIEAMSAYYRTTHANVHRGVYTFSERATELYEGARKKVARFIGAKSSREIIFTRNTTESINLVTQAWGRANLKPGDEILLTELEHHSNLVPWQLIAKETGARLRYIPVDEHGVLQLDALDTLLTERTKIAAFTQMSNMLGTITPATEIVRRVKAAGALTLIDGAQGIPHLPTNVQELGCDFLAFSGHKMCGPTGIGVLYGRRELLEAMPPFMGGGDMIRRVTYEDAEWNELPWKFEAGTPAIAEGIGLGAAVDYLSGLGMEAIRAHERELIAYALDRLAEVPTVTLYGPTDPDVRGGVATFNLGEIHPHDVAAVLDTEGVAIRAGHHCAMPLHQKFGLTASSRASFYVYSLPEEVDRLVEALYKAKSIYARK